MQISNSYKNGIHFQFQSGLIIAVVIYDGVYDYNV